MAWGSDTDAQVNSSASPQDVTGTELFSDGLTLNPGETAHVQVSTNSGGTTDSLEVKLYATLDATSEVWDTEPFAQGFIDATSGDTEVMTFVVTGVYKFRLGVVRSGSTDTLSTGINYRTDGVSV